MRIDIVMTTQNKAISCDKCPQKESTVRRDGLNGTLYFEKWRCMKTDVIILKIAAVSGNVVTFVSTDTKGCKFWPKDGTK